MGEAKRTRTRAATADEPARGSEEYRRYRIGGRSFYQRPLGLLQTTMFLETLTGVVVTSANALALFVALGARLGRAVAIALIPDGIDPVANVARLRQPGALDESEEWFDAYLESDQALEVLEDFFVCNRASSVLARAVRVMDQLLALQQQDSLSGSAPESSSTGSVPSSAGAAPLAATAS